MNSPDTTAEHAPSAAGIAGPMKMLLLALTGMLCLGFGIGLGLVLQGRQSATTEVAHKEHSGAEGEDSEQQFPIDDHDGEEVHEGAPADTKRTSEEKSDLHSAKAEEFLRGGTLHGESTSPTTGGESGLTEAGNETSRLRRSTSGSQLQVMAPELHSELNTPTTTGKEPPSERLVQADKLLMVGNYHHALEEYQSLLASAPTFLPAELRLRIALCFEAEGFYREAQTEYRKVIELNSALELQEAAILGLARLWNIAGRSELAIATLFRAVLTNGRQGETLARSQIPHELAVLLAQRVRKSGSEPFQTEDYYSDETLISPSLQIIPHTVITDLMGKSLTPPGSQVIAPHDLSVVERFSDHPDEIVVNVRTDRLATLELIRRLANRAGLTVHITEEARQRLQEHTLAPDCVNVPLGIALDAILEPFEVLWRVEGASLYLLVAKSAPAAEIAQCRRQSAMRSLRFAVRSAPQHPWAAASSIELARLTAQGGDLETAGAYLMKTLEAYPRSDFQSIAWYNLGKIELRQGRLDRALNAFHRAADLLVGHSLETMAYLYAGRVQLENDQPRESISAYTRALLLANGTEFESMAALQLSSAYFILGHLQRANEILMEHKTAISEPAAIDSAAFLVYLIQYHSTKDQNEKFRVGTTLLGAMTRLQLDHSFAGHWQWLAACAYREFGMPQQEIALLRANIRSPYPYPFQSRVRMMLLEDAPNELVGLQPMSALVPARGKPSDLYFKTQLQEATTLLNQGKTEAALQLSRALAEHQQIPDLERRAALRLMGRIYQTRGEHELAIQCFSGVIPPQGGIQHPPTAALPFPVRGVQ